MTSSDRIGLEIDEALHVMQILEEVVVSTHRIMSRAADGSSPGPLLEQYFKECNTWSRLSEARHVLAKALDREIGEDEVTDALQNIRYFLEAEPINPNGS